MLLGLVFARLALLEVSIDVCRLMLMLLLCTSDTAGAVDSLLLRQLLLAQSLVRGCHLSLVVWSFTLL